jgi:hypothetical protein
LSIGLAALAAASGANAAAPGSPYWGRWTVADEHPVFTAKGREYKTIDIALCGKDFCGVSVNDKGQCGATLFRFLMKRAAGTDELRGHGKWGTARKNVMIWLYQSDDPKEKSSMELYLGDGYDFGERSDNMPRFHGNYHNAGTATCKAR